MSCLRNWAEPLRWVMWDLKIPPRPFLCERMTRPMATCCSDWGLSWPRASQTEHGEGPTREEPRLLAEGFQFLRTVLFCDPAGCVCASQPQQQRCSSVVPLTGTGRHSQPPVYHAPQASPTAHVSGQVPAALGSSWLGSPLVCMAAPAGGRAFRSAMAQPHTMTVCPFGLIPADKYSHAGAGNLRAG